ncbi:hypothetical protein [Sporolactobacillus laevolacticus]|uniref:hypothetical protein n=1 Tax=Sporolactobacillus laevolacticus TaxID=33018 RepID=UPI0025B6213E|nr:hypothetical protein [Sporolactobacillus laevolacticus]MDN3955553.1 hypothetical protein [Sporolactobacillus laevolacticus]
MPIKQTILLSGPPCNPVALYGMQSPVQYFEFHEPYLWLDSTATKAEAIKSYVKYVSDDPDLGVLKEMPCDYAFEKLSDILRVEEKFVINEGILKEFEDRENGTLLIDGSFS